LIFRKRLAGEVIGKPLPIDAYAKMVGRQNATEQQPAAVA